MTWARVCSPRPPFLKGGCCSGLSPRSLPSEISRLLRWSGALAVHELLRPEWNLPARKKLHGHGAGDGALGLPRQEDGIPRHSSAARHRPFEVRRVRDVLDGVEPRRLVLGDAILQLHDEG